jgi:hypothetical protein
MPELVSRSRVFYRSACFPAVTRSVAGEVLTVRNGAGRVTDVIPLLPGEWAIQGADGQAEVFHSDNAFAQAFHAVLWAPGLFMDRRPCRGAPDPALAPGGALRCTADGFPLCPGWISLPAQAALLTLAADLPAIRDHLNDLGRISYPVDIPAALAVASAAISETNVRWRPACGALESYAVASPGKSRGPGMLAAWAAASVGSSPALEPALNGLAARYGLGISRFRIGRAELTLVSDGRLWLRSAAKTSGCT